MDSKSYIQKKPKILLVSDGSDAFRELECILEKVYIPICISDDSGADNIKKHISGVAAVVMTVKAAAYDDFGIFSWILADAMVASIPILIYCCENDSSQDVSRCLSLGAVDVITKPFSDEIILKRIRNAVRMQDSATFYEIEKMLKELPSNIYLKDNEGRYIFATHYWHHIDHGDDPEWTIRGKTDVEIRKDTDNAIKAMEADKELLRTGKGTAYTIEINADDKREFMEIIKQPVRYNSGEIKGIVGLINDVTEKELLRISLEESAMKDELTGVYNRRFFDQYTDTLEADRTRPVSIISADCNELKKINDTFGHIVGDEYIRMSAMLFRMVVNTQGRVFRVGGDEFIILLPGKTLGEAERIVEKLMEEEKNFTVKNSCLSISYGAACVTEPCETIRAYIDKADKLMYKNKTEYKRLRDTSKNN